MNITVRPEKDCGNHSIDDRSASLGVGPVAAINIQHESRLAPGFSLVDGRHLPTEGLTRFTIPLGGLNASDTPPALSAFGFDLAHFLLGVMRPAVVAKDRVRHGVPFKIPLTIVGLPPILADAVQASMRLNSPLSISLFKSLAPPIRMPLTKIIGKVGQPLHILSEPRCRQLPR